MFWNVQQRCEFKKWVGQDVAILQQRDALNFERNFNRQLHMFNE